MSKLFTALPSLQFRLMPEDASSISGRVDALYYFLVAVSTFFAGLIFVLVLYFALRYRHRPEVQQPATSHTGNLKLEITWIVIPFVLVMIMFGWGAKLFVEMRTMPPDALEVFVVGKQWMWKLQHPNGRREINELHVPVGRPVMLRMISEDVIHSFYVPAFRMKQDVLPGYYTTAWFEAQKTGRYHLFCAEYCGTEHSSMIGQVIVMEQEDYQRWLAGGDTERSVIELGQELFTGKGSCRTCHSPDSGPRGPDLTGLYGTTVHLQDGRKVTADENYLRESILRPGNKIVFGYESLMPPYEGQLSEEEVLRLIAYIKTLGGTEAAPGSPATRPAREPPTTAPAAMQPTSPSTQPAGARR
ncbi:MAG: cytochrome c oxidase subunit II [Phycisphaerae bacterium]